LPAEMNRSERTSPNASGALGWAAQVLHSGGLGCTWSKLRMLHTAALRCTSIFSLRFCTVAFARTVHRSWTKTGSPRSL
jgi:hypothetical protein